jgi:hypothetical protein
MSVTDQRLRALARRQHGVFSLKQVLDLGFKRSTITRLLERRVWEAVVPRVYRAAAARPLDWRQVTMATTLITRGVAAGRSAGALFELLPPPSIPEVVAPRASRTGLVAVVRTSSELPACDRTRVDGIPSTTPARTLIDLAGLLPLATFEDVLDSAIVQRVVAADRLRVRAVALRAPRRSGCAVVLSLLEVRHPDLASAANLWEARVARFVERVGLPAPEINFAVRVGGRRRVLDLAWPDAKVAVEFDGFVPHSVRRVFDDDRSRQNDLVDDDWDVFRVTKTMLEGDPIGVFRKVAGKVARKSPHVVKTRWNEGAVS